MVLWGFRLTRLGSRPRRGRRTNALQKVWRAVGEQVEFGANHLGMVDRRRRFVIVVWRGIRPACRGTAMSDKIALSDMIRNGPGRHAKGREIRPSGRRDGS